MTIPNELVNLYGGLQLVECGGTEDRSSRHETELEPTFSVQNPQGTVYNCFGPSLHGCHFAQGERPDAGSVPGSRKYCTCALGASTSAASSCCHSSKLAAVQIDHNHQQIPNHPQDVSLLMTNLRRWHAMNYDGYDIHPLTPERWDDFEAVLGQGGLGGCWCMYWLVKRSADWGEGQKGGVKAVNKDRFRAIVAQEPPPGLIAYEDDTPIAWARVMARSRHPGLANSRWFKTELDLEGIWSLSCFVVRKKGRGRGLTAQLTRAAADFARTHGATTLEVYPTETKELKHPATVYTGIASTFRKLGFEVVQAKAPHKPMMRFSL